MVDFEYKGKAYKVISNLLILDLDFNFCLDQDNKLFGFYSKKINDKNIYVEYSKLIYVLPKYQKIKYFNIKEIIYYFIENINIYISVGKIKKEEEIINFIVKFREYIEKNFQEFLNDDSKAINIDILSKMKDDIFTFKKVTFRNIIRKKRKRNAYKFVLATSILISITLSIKLLSWANDGVNAKQVEENIATQTIIEEKQVEINEKELTETDSKKITNLVSINFLDLKAQNPDTVAWIRVNNTNVNYAVVQGDDNEFYLNHDFYKNQTKSGWVYADYKSDFANFKNNTVLYAHGRTDYTMFGSLREVIKENWYTNTDNHIINLSTEAKDTLWQVISVYTIPAESYYLTHTFENDESYNKFLTTITSRSIYNFGYKINPKDKILTLSTCLDNSGNRIVLHAKLVKSEKK